MLTAEEKKTEQLERSASRFGTPQLLDERCAALLCEFDQNVSLVGLQKASKKSDGPVRYSASHLP